MWHTQPLIHILTLSHPLRSEPTNPDIRGSLQTDKHQSIVFKATWVFFQFLVFVVGSLSKAALRKCTVCFIINIPILKPYISATTNPK